MIFDTIPAPRYPTPNPYALGNVLGNLVGDFQRSQQQSQRTRQNDLQLQMDTMALNRAKAFSGGVPMGKNGMPDFLKAMNILAASGDPNAIRELSPFLMEERNIEGANAPDRFFDGGYSGSSGNVSAAPGPWSGNPFLSTLVGAESKGDNSASGDAGQAKGDFQFHDATWKKYAKNVPGASQYASAAEAPADVQQAVAETAPISEWGPRTRAILHAKFGPFNENQTIGQLADEFGGGKGVEVASLGGIAYAPMDQPSFPPASASAGSSIPRVEAPAATGSAGRAPGLAPQEFAGNGPEFSGINAALPVGRPGVRSQSSQGSVESIVSGTVGDPRTAGRLSRLIGNLLKVNPNVPLTPAQALRAKAIVGNYAARTSQQTGTAPPMSSGGQGAPSQGGPIVPRVPLPKGFTDPEQAILALRHDAARLSIYGPAAAGRIKFLEQWAKDIAASVAPLSIHAGTEIVDPRTGQTVFKAPIAASARMELLQDKADNIAQAIQAGDQPPVLTRLYGIAPLVQSTLAKDGFDLSRAQLQWEAAKKQILSLNSPQQIKFVGLANSVVNTIDEVKNIAQQMQLSGIPMFNKARLLAYIQAEGNTEKGQLATRYINAVNTAKEEFANLANGGFAPTDASWKLADQQINSNYGVRQLDAALSESQRLIKYRLAAMPGLSTAGPGSPNQYFPGNEQAPPPPALNRGSSGGLPPGWSVEVH